MLIGSFIQYLETERSYSPHTIIAYRHDLESFKTFLFENYELDLDTLEDARQVGHRMIRAWMGELAETGCGARSIARKNASLSSFFRHLLKTGKVDKNPVKLIKAPKYEKKLPSFLREDSIEKLFGQIEYPEGFEGLRDKCLLEILYSSGLRRAEIISLRFSDINFPSRTLKVLGKGNKERIVPFGRFAEDSMQAYMRQCDAENINCKGHFLVNTSSEPLKPRLVYSIVNKYLRQASTLSKTSPHVLRHTFATHLLDRGADLNAIKEMLGHTSLAATQVYVHNSISKLKDVYSKAHPKAGS